MINSIIEAISIALNKEFENYEIYMEEMKQGINEPCFFIACLKPGTELYLGKRYFTNNGFVIQYFPESKDCAQRECNSVAERLKWLLEYITMPDEDKPIRGRNINYEVVDGVLNFFITYDLFILVSEQYDVMETLESSATAE
jgi:hypothetical protein